MKRTMKDDGIQSRLLTGCGLMLDADDDGGTFRRSLCGSSSRL